MTDPDAAAAATSVVGGTAPTTGGADERPRSLGRDAWDQLRTNPVVIAAAIVVFIFIVMAIAPGLFTNRGPRECSLRLAREGPSGDAWFGRDRNGCDVFARTIYGARASIIVGILAASIVAIFGGLIGMLAGFYGGVIDSVISRVTDIFFGIPFLLGGIVVLVALPSGSQTSFWVPVTKVVIALAVLGWPSVARIMRSTTLQVKQSDYVAAARALGASTSRILRTHVLPNAVQPVIVYATILLGAFIAAEAALSYLGIGLQEPVVSWGIDISSASRYYRSSPHMLFFPGMALSLTVLAFIVVGDAVRDALDPKQR
jgi:oligopeptide transport system permease protein